MKNKHTFNIYWALNEGRETPKTLSPFLIVDEDNEYFYGFFGVEKEAKLEEIYHYQCLKIKRKDKARQTIIVLKNIVKIKKKEVKKDLYANLSEQEIQELIKKMNISTEINIYPENLKQKVLTTYKRSNIYDIVHYNGEYYCLWENIDEETFYAYKVSKVPNKTSLMIEQDGIKLFIDCGFKHKLKETDLLYQSNLSDMGIYQIMVFLKNNPISGIEEDIPKTIRELWVGSSVMFDNKKGIVLNHGYTHTKILIASIDDRFTQGHIDYVLNSDNKEVHFEGIVSSSKLQYILQKVKQR